MCVKLINVRGWEEFRESVTLYKQTSANQCVKAKMCLSFLNFTKMIYNDLILIILSLNYFFFVATMLFENHSFYVIMIWSLVVENVKGMMNNPKPSPFRSWPGLKKVSHSNANSKLLISLFIYFLLLLLLVLRKSLVSGVPNGVTSTFLICYFCNNLMAKPTAWHCS